MQLKSGTTLQNGRFKIVSCIGDGGFGITYLARDERLDREVVLKEYFPDYMVKRDTTATLDVTTLDLKYKEDFHTGITKFLNEAKILAQFNNIPGIADVYDFFPENNTAYIVMEYIKGQNLKSIIKSRKAPYTFKEALITLAPCMFALQKVHEAGIIHRDFAPDNILVDEKGRMKIIDFGSSRDFVGANATMTIMVKHGYAPAEQYSNAVKQGPYTDVYSLGAIFYEMLTLQKPNPSVDRIFKDTLTSIIEINPSITPAQNAVVMKAMAVSYEARFQSVEDFSNELKKLENDSVQNASAPVNAYNQAQNPGYAQQQNSYAQTQNTSYGDTESTELVQSNNSVPQAQYNQFGYQANNYSENNQNGYTSYNNGNYTQYQGTYNVPQQKKSKKGLIIAIIAAIVVLGTVGIIFLNSDSGSSRRSSSRSSNKSDLEIAVTSSGMDDLVAEFDNDLINQNMPNVYMEVEYTSPTSITTYYRLYNYYDFSNYTDADLEDEVDTYYRDIYINNANSIDTYLKNEGVDTCDTVYVYLVNQDGTVFYSDILTRNNN